MTDPITDMFNRIRNAQNVMQEDTDIPCSKLKLRIIEILKREGFVKDFKKKGRKPHQLIKVDLKYHSDKTPCLAGFKRVSKPGRRIYRKAKEIRGIRDGYGLALISTSRGLMTDKEARKKKMGGEVMVELW